MMLRRSPQFNAFLVGNPADYRTGCYQFRELLQVLADYSVETSGWQVHRSFEDGPQQSGLDPIRQIDEVIAFNVSHGFDNADGLGSMRVSAGFYRDGAFASKKISYVWGGHDMRDTLTLEIEDMRYIAPVTLDRYLALCDILLTWQRPRYMWVGDPNYVYKKHGLFDGHRTVANWIAWVPQTVTPAQIPSAHLVRPHLGGTLIVTQPDFFNINDNQPAIDRANAVEYEMNEAGVLPLLTDLY
jgi:hypothetical protein